MGVECRRRVIFQHTVPVTVISDRVDDTYLVYFGDIFASGKWQILINSEN